MGQSALVVSRDLSKDMNFSGRFLTKQLEASNVPLSASMWFLFPDQQWRLVLIVTDLQERGVADVFRKISQINRTNKSKSYKQIQLDFIEIKGKSSFLYTKMQGFAHVESGSIRISNSMFNGFDIIDCLIYKFI